MAIKGEFVLSPDDTPEKQDTPPENGKSETPTHHVPETNKPLPISQELQTVSETIKQKLRFHKKPHFYSSLAFYPEGVTFENQEEDESIILLVRRDFITNLPWILSAIFLSILPFVIVPFMSILFPFEISDTTRILFLAFYYLAIFGFVIVEFSLWYYHVGIVTNKHIIDVDVHGILIRDVARTKLHQVEDVKYSQIGVVRSIFNYGDVHIQTAGTNVNFEFDKAPEPSIIIQILQDLIGGHKK